METKLSVNINKIATIRNARGGNTPNLVEVAVDIENFGADGITIHPRPDERHITLQDTYDLNKVVKTEFNIEGYPNERFLQIISELKPTQATLVPDPPNVLTSNAGWDTITHFDFLKKVVSEIKGLGVRVSLFIETDSKMITKAAELGADRIEFYTGPYAEQYTKNKEKAISAYIKASEIAVENGLEINAGHDLSLENLKYFKQNIPNLAEVSFGHALISDELYLGIENTVAMYKELLVD